MSYRFDAALKGIVAQHAEDFASVFGLPRTMVTALNVDPVSGSQLDRKTGLRP